MDQHEEHLDRQPWSTPELRTTDAGTSAFTPGPASDGTIEAVSTFSIL